MEHKDISILIVSNNQNKISEKLLSSMGYRLLKTEHNGFDALKSICVNKPMVILSEAFLPKLDFLGILDNISATKETYVSICVSETANDILAARLMKRGADYFFIHPCDYTYLSRVIDAFVEEKFVPATISSTTSVSEKFRMEDRVIEILNHIGMPSNLLGYQYVRCAILMALQDEKVLRSVTKGLYQEIANVYNTKASSVERAIRTAICVTWDRGNFEAQTSIFGYVIKDSKGKPTNSEFIAEIVHTVSVQSKI